MKFLNKEVAFSLEADNLSADFHPLIELPLVIMVGLTGVGKSTVLELLPEQGLKFTLLPNRRDITDQIIIASLQAEAGQPVGPVTDRLERFEYTARYRDKFPGGMAHALSRLIINAATAQSLLIFDGLRGLNEVQHAVTYFPLARFVVLDAPDTVRLTRLLNRGDVFDVTSSKIQADLPASQDLMAALRDVPHVEAVFNEESLHQIAAGARLAQIPVGEVVQKISIIVKERRNYDSSTARVHLTQTLPPQQVLVIDTASHPARVVAEKIAHWLK
jgi:hypothetical protein